MGQRKQIYLSLVGCVVWFSCKTSQEARATLSNSTQKEHEEFFTIHEMGQAEPAPIYAKGLFDSVIGFRMWSSCDKKSYAIGLSQGRRIFCVQDQESRKSHSEPVSYVKNVLSTESPRFDRAFDWAYQRHKIECAKGFYVTGIIADADRRLPLAGHLGIICTQDQRGRIETGGEHCTTVWFDRNQDGRTPGESRKRSVDWHPDQLKGQCAQGSYMAGIAYFDEWIINHENPNAILCCEWKK